jgi:hypothetical protein
MSAPGGPRWLCRDDLPDDRANSAHAVATLGCNWYPYWSAPWEASCIMQKPALVLAALLLGACATPYQHMGFMGGVT